MLDQIGSQGGKKIRALGARGPHYPVLPPLGIENVSISQTRGGAIEGTERR